MVVCVCNNLNEVKIQQAKAAGCKSPCAAYKFFGCKVQCGTCCDQTNNILKS